MFRWFKYKKALAKRKARLQWRTLGWLWLKRHQDKLPKFCTRTGKKMEWVATVHYPDGYDPETGEAKPRAVIHVSGIADGRLWDWIGHDHDYDYRGRYSWQGFDLNTWQGVLHPAPRRW